MNYPGLTVKIVGDRIQAYCHGPDWILRHVPKDIADDIRHDAILAFIQWGINHPGVPIKVATLNAFITKITEHKLIDWKRKKKPVSLIEDPLDHRKEEIKVDLSGLSEIQRKTIELVYYDNLSALEAGEKLGLNPNTIRSHVSRGIKKLREQIQDLLKSKT